MPTTIHYDALRRKLRRLEGKVLNPVPPTGSGVNAEIRKREAGSQVQVYGLDNSTAGEEWPVVVTIGGNYTQANSKVPRDTDKTHHVQDGLNSCRKHLADSAVNYNKRKSFWADKSAVSAGGWSIPENFHLIMTNFCIWITEHSWQNIRPHIRADLLENNPLFGNNPTSPGHWAHLTALRAQLEGYQPIWVGHGMHCEVFALFRQFLRSYPSDRWILVPNLAYRYDYVKWPYPA